MRNHQFLPVQRRDPPATSRRLKFCQNVYRQQERARKRKREMSERAGDCLPSNRETFFSGVNIGATATRLPCPFHPRSPYFRSTPRARETPGARRVAFVFSPFRSFGARDSVVCVITSRPVGFLSPAGGFSLAGASQFRRTTRNPTW